MFKITDVNIKRNPNGNFLAYVSIVIDNCLVIHNIKIIQGTNGQFIFMPDRPVDYKCPTCFKRIRLTSNYCSHCGSPLKPIEIEKSEYVNVIYPITQECRQYIHNTIMEVYNRV